MRLRFNIDNAEIHRLYTEEKITQQEIGRRYGITRQAVSYRLRIYREQLKSGKVPFHRDTPAEMELIKDRFQKGWTLDQLGKELGLTPQAIRYRLQVSGVIPPRKPRRKGTDPKKKHSSRSRPNRYSDQ
ncbi:MAG: hypothetical protein H0V76_12665 [Blastocatellia bacterium]|nr:hypothetical protein [Blastocatellia bacterium]